jgi:hypothetical protein
VLLATGPNLSVEDKNGVYSLTTPSGEEHQFNGMVDVLWRISFCFNKIMIAEVDKASSDVF